MTDSVVAALVACPKIHVLKTWPEMYAAVSDGLKTVEIRRDDRGYRVGDLLLLRCYDPVTATFSGARCVRKVTHIVRSDMWGLRSGFVAMSLHDPGVDPAHFEQGEHDV
jgi:hypothetical protein